MTDQPTDESQAVTELTDEESWEMLRRHEVGRLAFHLADEVHIVPVNYAVDGEQRIVFRTAEGSKLLGLTMNADVAFEIDQYDSFDAHSVIVRGRARQLTGAEAEVADLLPRRPWVPGSRDNVVAITVDEMTGRAFHLRSTLQR